MTLKTGSIEHQLPVGITELKISPVNRQRLLASFQQLEKGLLKHNPAVKNVIARLEAETNSGSS